MDTRLVFPFALVEKMLLLAEQEYRSFGISLDIAEEIKTLVEELHEECNPLDSVSVTLSVSP